MPMRKMKMTMTLVDQGLQRQTLPMILLVKPKPWQRHKWKRPRKWLETSAAFNNQAPLLKKDVEKTTETHKTFSL